MQTRMKRKLEAQNIQVEAEASDSDEQPLCFLKKQFRSKLSRRERKHIISPIIQDSSTSISVSNNESQFRAISDVTCDSRVASVNAKKRESEIEAGFEDRRVTISYYRKKLENESRNCDELELQESSCVESSSGVALFGGSINRELKLKSETKGGEDPEAVTKSEISSASRFEVNENKNSVEISQDEATSKFSNTHNFSGEFLRKVLRSEKSDTVMGNDVSFDSVKDTTKITGNGAGKDDVTSEFSFNSGESNYVNCTAEHVATNINLACSEQFSSSSHLDCEEEEYSSSAMFTETSDMEFDSSEFSSLFSLDSGSQFSEKSIEDESTSPTFQLFKQFKEQFCRSTFATNYNSKACENYYSHDTLLGLEQEEDEESYRMLRSRERRQVYLFDYAEEYCSTTRYGQLVIQQRLQMVHWMVEHATNKEFQKETMFLGVSLLDRFLCMGYFRNKRNLQIVGIACVTLATRLEENQPYNSIRRKTFNVGNTTYNRCEVVAMEWLVLEVLNFQCFLPTYYNFLWFYLKAVRANEQVKKTTRYLAILALLGHQQLCYWPSTVAASIVILASAATNQGASCHLLKESHARQNDNDLPKCIKSLECLLKYIN